ncbi:coniferyl aldehyde dehydrogenase [Sphingopyxis sp.]|uniref:coniferyl aldehyde dehydrogenase n=1 Tax=Sphingopyxis sp. TaxID=1908224 RepID=UPI002D7897FE|nr:coniferyl aldehyde dehydrogenase [Sphingopyxis sp.]HET6525134.1 coniferyl aldehyde dehydrogenase [Sphingopyxis sp.]
MTDLLEIVARQRAAHLTHGAPDAEARIDRLDRCIALLKENGPAFEAALNADFGNRSAHASALTDIMTPVGALQHARKHVRKWMRSEKRPVDPWFLGLLGAKAHIRFQPKGVVGIVSPWNFPVGLVFSPLASVFAAGNRAVVKPSEYTPRTAELMQSLIEARFADDELAVVTGGPEIGAAFAALPFDHLIFTGAGSIASHVLRAAADNLVPVTLELGGKSPVVIGKGADMRTAAARVMAGKVLNAGQICLAPDHVYVREDARDAFVASARSATERMLPTVRDNPDYTAIISDRHLDRLKSYLADAEAKGARIIEINPANEKFDQQEHRKMPPTLVLGATPDMAVMQEEIFGPILPVISYRELDDVTSRVNTMDRPLALYYFGSDGAELAELEQKTTSGGICVNDVIMHCAQENLPFGGIGPSGMGAYHGRDGFLEFSHKKAVYHQIRRDLGPLRTLRPPYGDAVRKLIKSTIGA